MKKVLYFAAIILGMSILFTSCSKDKYQDTIAGFWVFDSFINGTGEDGSYIIDTYIEFRESGLVNIYSFVDDGYGSIKNGLLTIHSKADPYVVQKASYFVTEDLLTFDGICYEITIIDNNTISLKEQINGGGAQMYRIKQFKNE